MTLFFKNLADFLKVVNIFCLKLGHFLEDGRLTSFLNYPIISLKGDNLFYDEKKVDR